VWAERRRPAARTTHHRVTPGNGWRGRHDEKVTALWEYPKAWIKPMDMVYQTQ